MLKKVIQLSQKKNNLRYISSSKNKCKASWMIINNKTRQANNSDIKIKFNSNIISDPNDIGEIFNNYYINLVESNKTNTPVNKVGTLTQAQPQSIFLSPSDPKEIMDIIKSLNNTTAVGYDCIPTSIIKQCSSELVVVLCYLINLSFEKGVFPEKLKISVVKPIFKKNDKLDLNNYRPITLIPILSKVFEKAMHYRLMNYLTKYNIINDNQNGFQKGKSTSLAAFNLVNSILPDIDKGKFVSAVFLDMSKAFDYVSHERLLHKCNIYGIRGLAQDWIKSYLYLRSQCVELSKLNSLNEVTTYRSQFKINSHGVPQGSVLGPLLFLLYINDLPEVIEYKCILFADDVSVVVNSDTEENHVNDLNATIKTCIDWLTENNLKVNVNKTKFLQFYNRKQKSDKIPVVYNNEEILESNNINFLGLKLDSNCSWKFHLEYVNGRLNSFVFALWKLARITDYRTALLAYHGHVASVLRYGVILWGNAVNVNSILITQKKCIRAIFNEPPWNSCKPYFKEYKLLTLPCIYILEICKFVKQYKHLFIKFDDYYRYGSRHFDRLVIPSHVKSALQYRNCYTTAVIVYNKLPRSIKELNGNLFNRKLYNLLIDKCFYSVQEFLDHKF